jgi:hypothetical protein
VTTTSTPARRPKVTVQRTYASTLLLLAGTAIVFVGACLAAGSTNATNGDGTTGSSAELVFGAAVAAVGLPLMLAGVIAVGIRIGLRDRDRDRDRS